MSPAPAFREPFALHVVWHGNEESAAAAHAEPKDPGWFLANQLYDRLIATAAPPVDGPTPRDPDLAVVRTPGIPVRFYRGVQRDQDLSLPLPVDLDAADRVAVALFVDDDMFAARDLGWRKYVDEMMGAVAERKKQGHRVLPIMTTPAGPLLSESLRNVNFIPAVDARDASSFGAVVQSILHALLRMAWHDDDASSERRLRVFLCHAKRDGAALARHVRDYIHRHTQFSTFFDLNDIPHGELVSETITKTIADSAMLVIHTDALLRSRWCQLEIITARKHQCPVVVVDALIRGEPRSSPFLANLPVLRLASDAAAGAELDANLSRIVDQMLLEVLRSVTLRWRARYFGTVDALERRVHFCLDAPDHLSLQAMPKGTAYFVYPDPPITAPEQDVWEAFRPNVRMSTVAQLVGRLSAGSLDDVADLPLGGQRIGLSVSAPASLMGATYSKRHIEDILADIGRCLLSLGASLAYGGDLRRGGFTGRLVDMATLYGAGLRAAADQLESFLAWPWYLSYSREDKIDLGRRAQVHQCDLPAELRGAARLPLGGDGPRPNDNPYLQARGLTEMRRKMTERCTARVILAGKLTGCQGRYPGLIEEAMMSIEARQPVYLLGGFGGCARAAYDLIIGADSDEANAITWDRQLSEKKEYLELKDQYGQSRDGSTLDDAALDFDQLRRAFQEVGLDGLGALNGLTARENEQLSSTTNPMEMVSLVVRGLSVVLSRPKT